MDSNPNITEDGKSKNSLAAIARDHYPPHNRELYHLPLDDLRKYGVLWYINRVAFHPRGLSLALTVDKDRHVVGWSLIGDGEEPFNFEPDDDDEEFAKFKDFLAQYFTGLRPEGEW